MTRSLSASESALRTRARSGVLKSAGGRAPDAGVTRRTKYRAPTPLDADRALRRRPAATVLGPSQRADRAPRQRARGPCRPRRAAPKTRAVRGRTRKFG